MDVVKKSRPGGRSRNKRKSNPFSISQTPWSLPINNDNFIEPVSLEGVEKIHNTAMRILEDIGIEFINEEAKSILKKAGCKVDLNSDNVKMDRNWVMEMIKNAPQEFEIIPRNKKNKVII